MEEQQKILSYPEMDYSHNDFFYQSKGDLASSELLFKEQNFSQAVYLFQQSVEKSCKYLGLTYKIISYEDLRKIGHNPHQVFKQLFDHQWLKFQDGNTFNELLNSLSTLSIENRIEPTINLLNTLENEQQLSCNNGQNACEVIIDFYKKNPLIKDLDQSFLTDLEIFKHSPCMKILCKQHIEHLNKVSIVFLSQMIMSFYVWDVEANSRYPDYKKMTTPQELYSESSAFVKHLPRLLLTQKKCLRNMETCFMEE